MDKNLEQIKNRAIKYMKSNNKSMSSKIRTNNNKEFNENKPKKKKTYYKDRNYYYEFPAGIRN